MIEPAGLLAYAWRGPLDRVELESLHSEAFKHAPRAYDGARSSIVTAFGHRARGRRLIGFVNLAWDGGSHAFLLGLVVASDARRRGIGRALVTPASTHARAAGCECSMPTSSQSCEISILLLVASAAPQPA